MKIKPPQLYTEGKDEIKELKFIPEQPKTDLSSLEFGHPQIVESLKTIISSVPNTFNIGLIGSWGSGKSSIVESLKNQYKYNSSVDVLIFDVWKNEGDSLRRAFLYYITNEYDLKINSRYNSKLRQLQKGRFNPDMKPLIILSLILVVLVLVGFTTENLGIIASITSASFLATIFAKYVYDREVITLEPFKDPYEFGLEFESILGKLYELHKRKIVIVFDNLDRVTNKEAKNVLSTIKTYIVSDKLKNAPDVINIIPCDIDKLILDDSERIMDAEYFRKIFNTQIHLPRFERKDFEKYLFEIISQTNSTVLKTNGLIQYFILEAFQNNPRQLIHFVNLLVANLISINSKENPVTDLSKELEVALYTKMLILKSRFSNLWGCLLDSNTPISGSESIKDVINQNDEREYSEEFSALNLFLDATRQYEIENLRFLFNQRKSRIEDLFGSFDNFEKMFVALAALGRDQSIEAVSFFKENNIIEAYSDIKGELKRFIFTTNIPNRKMLLINSFFRLLGEFNLPISNSYLNELFHELSSGSNLVEAIDVEYIFTYLSKLNLSKGIKENYLNMVRSIFFTSYNDEEIDFGLSIPIEQ
jgi:GTPase SAR1 family protein